MSIVPQEKLKNDPQQLLYHFPSMNSVRYTKLSNEFNFWRSVAAVESTAKICGKLLVPKNCLHWERKTRFQDRRVVIQKHSFYILSWDELTPFERRKYQAEAIPQGVMA